jgi:ribosomal protein L14
MRNLSKHIYLLQKQSWMYITDNTNIRWIRIFHLYKGWKRRVTYPGFFVKGSARVVEPPRQEYKGFKYRYSLKGDICRSWIVRSNKMSISKDRSVSFIGDNCGFIIRKKQDPKSKFLNGPITKTLKRRKLKTLFKVLL